MISQPAPLSDGRTVVAEKADITIAQQPGSLVQMPSGTRLADVVKALNSLGATPQDLLATIYRHLGIDHRAEFRDLSGRPVPILSDGEPIRELI